MLRKRGGVDTGWVSLLYDLTKHGVRMLLKVYRFSFLQLLLSHFTPIGLLGKPTFLVQLPSLKVEGRKISHYSINGFRVLWLCVIVVACHFCEFLTSQLTCDPRAWALPHVSQIFLLSACFTPQIFTLEPQFIHKNIGKFVLFQTVSEYEELPYSPYCFEWDRGNFSFQIQKLPQFLNCDCVLNFSISKIKFTSLHSPIFCESNSVKTVLIDQTVFEQRRRV